MKLGGGKIPLPPVHRRLLPQSPPASGKILFLLKALLKCNDSIILKGMKMEGKKLRKSFVIVLLPEFWRSKPVPPSPHTPGSKWIKRMPTETNG